MEHQIRQTKRWAHWIFGLGAAAIGLGFGWIIVRMLQGSTEFGEGVRVFIPSYLLASYWLIATVVNMRTVVLSTKGLSVTVWPIPVRKRFRFERAQIRCCYTRYVTLVDEDGVERHSFYMAGVETWTGFQVNLYGPFESYEPAVQAARELADVVNAGERPDRHISVDVCDRDVPVSKHTWQTLVWGGAFIVAILLGAWWEVSRFSGGIHYTGPKF